MGLSLTVPHSSSPLRFGILFFTLWKPHAELSHPLVVASRAFYLPTSEKPGRRDPAMLLTGRLLITKENPEASRAHCLPTLLEDRRKVYSWQ